MRKYDPRSNNSILIFVSWLLKVLLYRCYPDSCTIVTWRKRNKKRKRKKDVFRLFS